MEDIQQAVVELTSLQVTFERYNGYDTDDRWIMPRGTSESPSELLPLNAVFRVTDGPTNNRRGEVAVASSKLRMTVRRGGPTAQHQHVLLNLPVGA